MIHCIFHTHIHNNFIDTNFNMNKNYFKDIKRSLLTPGAFSSSFPSSFFASSGCFLAASTNFSSTFLAKSGLFFNALAACWSFSLRPSFDSSPLIFAATYNKKNSFTLRIQLHAIYCLILDFLSKICTRNILVQQGIYLFDVDKSTRLFWYAILLKAILGWNLILKLNLGK